MKLVKEYNIKGIIIGNPLNMDGSSGRSAQSVNDVSGNILTELSMWMFVFGMKDFQQLVLSIYLVN